MTTLVLAEHDNLTLKPSTNHTITAAIKIGHHGGGEVVVLVAGYQCDPAAAEAATIKGVAKVLHADGPSYAHPLAENLACTLVTLAKGYSHVLAPATAFGKNVLPRAAALMDTQQVSDISEIIDAETFVRPIYAGNALATVRSSDAVKFITVRTTSFDAAQRSTIPVHIENVKPARDTGQSTFVRARTSVSDRPELTTAKIVISGGRGMGSGENFKLLEAIADKLGAAIGASRAAVDAGYVPNDWLVGQTGKVVAPDLYIAVGISGAIQHLAGMKDSKVIVAINRDKDAPIFQVADFGLVMDLADALPQLNEALEKIS